jgi:ATP-dependent protease Clp ATPase subunit
MKVTNPKLDPTYIIHFSCGFCGKTNDEVKLLLAGPITQICNECIVLAANVLVDKVIINRAIEVVK